MTKDSENGTPPAIAPETGESSGPAPGRRTALKIGIIAAVAATVLAFGTFEARLLPGLERSVRTIPRNAPDLEADYPLPEGDYFMGSEVVHFNGVKGYHLKGVSEKKPREVIEAFVARLKERGYKPGEGRNPGDRGYYVQVRGKGYAMLSWRDREGRRAGVTAYLNPESLGTNYFLSRTAEADPDTPERGEDGDAPGRDIPGVARPPAATREFCVDKPGPHLSMMVLYESTASAASVQAHMRSRMTALRWEEPPGASQVLSDHADGFLLRFTRGRESCHVNIVEDGELSAVTIIYRKNDP